MGDWSVEKEKVVFSRANVSLSETQALEDAFKLFIPSSKDFAANSQDEIWDFLCSFRHEGFAPVILRSKDVYGYSSCRSVVPDKSLLSRRVTDTAQSGPKKRPQAVPSDKKKKRRRKRGGFLGVRRKRRKTSNSPEEHAPPVKRPHPAVPAPVWTGSAASHDQKALNRVWRAASDRSTAVRQTVQVKDVSSKRSAAAARSKAEKLLKLNLSPVLKLRRLILLK
ncbi:coiled-coil domain-containing protein 71L-like [Erpetoichthys calabaricus]|uniref:coiled-coil domain-containing protein 71L-like n=1 Tax=Erpetoichthys calabaricus TaxID=27687 RepID=UPI002234463A|nr:coiled-coil domain-containing protein 71L-like [Erpetoichthys calabaricus]